MNFTPLASSSAANAYVVSQDGAPPLLIECGMRWADLRAALGWEVSGHLTGALVSHSHGDHARAVPDALRAGIDVWASRGTWRALGERAWDHHRAHELSPRERVRIGRDWEVMPFDLRHDAEGCLGFLVGAADGDRLVFATDTAYLPYRFAGVSHWALECNYSSATIRASSRAAAHRIRVLRNHMGLERVLRSLARNDLSATREIHLLHLSDDHGDADGFVDAVRAATGKPAFAAPKGG